MSFYDCGSIIRLSEVDEYVECPCLLKDLYETKEKIYELLKDLS